MCPFFCRCILIWVCGTFSGLKKSASKLTGLHAIFAKFRFLGRCQNPGPYGDRSGGYKEGNSVSHFYMDDVSRPFVLSFLCQNRWKYNAPRMTMPEHISPNFFRQNNVVHIVWLVRSSDMSTIELV